MTSGRKEKLVKIGGQTMKLIVIRDSRHPWVVSVLVGCVISGVVGLVLPPDPRVPIDQLIPSPYREFYYAALLAAGLVTLIGIWLPRLRDRLMVELMGMWFVSAPLLLYPVFITVVLGAPVGVGGIVSSTFGLGGVIRVVGIFLELRTMRIAEKEALV